jgi:tRNA (cytidine/uridine-2'-O-)-methyltransferase
MDYVGLADIVRQPDWHGFLQSVKDRRLVLATTSAGQTYADFRFRPDDILLFGRESSGVPDTVRDQVPCHIKVPMQPGARSLNVAIAAAMITGEAMRQTAWQPA